MNAAVATPIASSTVAPSVHAAPATPLAASLSATSSIAYTYKRFPVTIVRGEGVTLFDGGNQMGVAYSAPCPGATNSSYAVTVYALGDGDVVLGIGEKALGWAP